jgi:histidine ammonia-lyase
MLVRLNTLLLGCTGIQPEIVTLYMDFLNNEIHPILPERSSVGVADISCLAHIGLAMIGEGEVYYKGVRMSSIVALERVGLQPLKLGPKDGLAIVSSNAVAAGKGALVLKDAKDILEIAEIIFSLSLEGLHGNVSPLDEGANKVKSFPGQKVSASNVRKYLENSFLWEEKINNVQDPLSFRDAIQVHGSVRDSIEYISNYLYMQLNSSDDNPCLLVDEKRIISCSNYEVLTWVLGFEMLANALNHLAKISCYRSIKLSTPYFTGLSRFLSPNKKTIAYGTIQKTFTSLANEIRHLSNPSSSDYFSLAGDIEDHASNSVHVVTKISKIIDNLYYILGMEAMHAVQAIDLRNEKELGIGTLAAYELIRSKNPFLEKDLIIFCNLVN